MTPAVSLSTVCGDLGCGLVVSPKPSVTETHSLFLFSTFSGSLASPWTKLPGYKSTKRKQSRKTETEGEKEKKRGRWEGEKERERQTETESWLFLLEAVVPGGFRCMGWPVLLFSSGSLFCYSQLGRIKFILTPRLYISGLCLCGVLAELRRVSGTG